MIIIFLIFFIFTPMVYAGTSTNQPGPLFGDVDGTNAGRYRSIKFTNGTTTNNSDGSISISTGGTAAGNSGEVQYNGSGSFSGLPRSVMNSSGNFGIGTTSTPSALLHLNTGLAQDVFRVDDSVSDTSPFLIDQGGNTGIGTFSPSAMMHLYQASSGGVTPTMRMQSMNTSGSPFIFILNSDSDSLFMRQLARGSSGSLGGSGATQISAGPNTGNTFVIYTSSATDMILGTNSTERIRVTSSGNVGIGTSVASTLLSIGGNVLLDRTTSAIIMKESDGTCGSCVLSSTEVFTCSSIACP